ncbi:MAG TPA: hypothetical protein DIS98_06260 [Colwellia sp.]|nr:hypothetical protein [Colwellia sp.]
MIDELSQLHPKLNLNVDFVERHIDLLAEDYELAIRVAELKNSVYKLGNQPLLIMCYVLFVSPDYITKHGFYQSAVDH